MRIAFSLALILLAAGCVPKPPEPPPPARTPLPEPSLPPPAQPVLGEDWRDWPLTPGDWRYRREGGGTIAAFGAAGAMPLLTLRCDPAARQVTLSLSGAGASAITVRTTSTTRSLPVAAMAHADAMPPATLDARLAATDPLLDAMGFSRGRFVIEQAGRPPLVVPAWAEVERVTEDCRG